MFVSERVGSNAHRLLIFVVLRFPFLSMVCRLPMEAKEIQVIKRPRYVAKMPALRIAKSFGFHKKTIYKALRTLKILSHGRPRLFSPKETWHIVTVLKKLMQIAKARFEIAMAMMKNLAKVGVRDKTVRRVLASEGKQFRRLRTKPSSAKDGIKDRYAFPVLVLAFPALCRLAHVFFRFSRPLSFGTRGF